MSSYSYTSTSPCNDDKTAIADLSVSVTDQLTAAIPGTAITYAIVVKNSGIIGIKGATLTETVPSSLTGIEYFQIINGTAVKVTSLSSLSINLAAGQSITYQVRGILDSSATGAIAYSVKINTPTGISDPNLSNNTATDCDVLTPVADLSITTTNNRTEVIPGTEVTYLVTVRNDGPSDVVGAKLEGLPSSLTNIKYYSQNGTLLSIASLNDLSINLKSGAQAVYQVKGIVDPAARETISYNVAIKQPTGTKDPFLANNTASDTDRLTPKIDLSIKKSFDLNTVKGLDNNGDRTADQYMALPGDTIAYQLLITNSGPSTATNVRVFEDLTKQLPVGLHFVSLTGGTLFNTDSNLDTVEIGLGNIASGQSVAVTIQALVSKDYIKTYNFVSLLGTINPETGLTNLDIPEYQNILLKGQFYVPLTFTKEANDAGINFHHLNIQTETSVSATEEDINLANNTTKSRLDVSTIALDGTLNNGAPVSIRSIERLGAVPSDLSYFVNPDPVLLNGKTSLQFNAFNTSTSTKLVTGGTVTFELVDVTGTAGVDGKYGTADDGIGKFIDKLSIIDGSAGDFDTDLGEVLTTWVVDKSLIQASSVFKLTTSGQSKSLLSTTTQTFTNYFDSKGVALPSTIVSTKNSTSMGVSVTPAVEAVVQVKYTNPLTTSYLKEGGKVTFDLIDVTATNTADGIYRAATGKVVQTFAINDGQTGDLDADAKEIISEFLINKFASETTKIFAIRASTSDIIDSSGVPSPSQQYVSYFDINGRTITTGVDTTGNSTSIQLGLTTSTSSGGDTASPTTNHSQFLLAGDTNGDGILDEYGASTFEFFWNKLSDPTYLCDLAHWAGMTADGDLTNTSDEQAVVNFLYNKFLDSKVYSFDNFINGSFTLINQNGQSTTIEVTDGEITPDDPNPFRSIADLSLSFGEPVVVDDKVIFTLTIKNTLGDNATGVAVKNLLPSGFSYTSSNSSLGTYDSGTGIWQIGNLNLGSQATLTVTAKMLKGASISSYTNTAEIIASNQFDPDSTVNNQNPAEDDQASVTPKIADLSLSFGEPVIVGNVATFTLTIKNTLGNNATAIQVKNLLPAGLTFISSDPSLGSYDSITGLWNVGNLNLGSEAKLTVKATMLKGYSIANYTNTAEIIKADQFDSDSTVNNQNPAEDDQTSVTPKIADLSLSFGEPVVVGDIATFTLTIKNTLGDNATGVVVKNSLPTGFTCISSSSPSYTYDSLNGYWKWDVGNLASEGQQTLTVTAKMLKGTATASNYTNTAEIIKADQFDPDSTPGNNNPTEDDQTSVMPAIADLSLSFGEPVITNGDTVTFTLTAANTFGSNATGVIVKYLLPSLGFNVIGSSTSLGGYNSGTGYWNIGNLNLGSQATLSVTTKILNCTSTLNYINTAEIIAANQFDPDSTVNNNNPAEDDQARVAPLVGIIVNDSGAIVNGKTYVDLETALQSISFVQPVGLKINFIDTNGDGSVRTRWQNASNSINPSKKWYISQINIDSSLTNQVIISSDNGAANLDFSGIDVQFKNPTNIPKLMILGVNAKDSIVGTSKNDVIQGLNGNDNIYGFDGDDDLIGGSGADILVGGKGNDRLYGDAFNIALDQNGKCLVDSNGKYIYVKDKSSGGSGDQFVFDGIFGNDTIFDLDGQDKIVLRGFGLSGASFDKNRDGIINSNDITSGSAYVRQQVNSSLVLDLTTVGGGTIALDGITSLNVNALIFS